MRLDGKMFVWYAAWKHHISIYPFTLRIQQQFADRLKGYKKTKGTIQFPIGKPLPVTLLRQLIKARIAELR
jgi:uncharacterized protein YdhG (YjbR/CyaY superfamily)